MFSIYNHFNNVTTILISLAIILFSGFILTRITKLFSLPNVTGYIIAGILIGPFCLNLIEPAIIDNMGFVSDIALGFIAFDVGRYFEKEALKGSGEKVVIITLFEALLAGVLVTLIMHYFFLLDWNLSLLLGAIGTATAPASTLMTINQYHGKGEFVNTLLQVVAFDDVICILAFTIVTAIANTNRGEGYSIYSILGPIIYNLIALTIGFISGFILYKLITPNRSKENKLILVVAMVLSISGFCAICNVSPLLSCMVFGASYINLSKDKELFKQVNNFTPPIMSMFFIISGMNLNLSMLSSMGIIGVGYFIIRIIGKYIGTYIGALVTKSDIKIKKYLGLALFPQAGVAIGLAFLGQRLLPPSIGELLLTIILSSSVLYELIGPICAKKALIFSGAIKYENSRIHFKDNVSYKYEFKEEAK